MALENITPPLKHINQPWRRACMVKIMFHTTVINESVDSKDNQPLQPLHKLRLTSTNGILLAHPPLHHLVELVTGYGAHPHQQRVCLG